MDKTLRLYAALIGAALSMALAASANPIAVTSTDTPGVCDALVIPTTLEELGNAPPFPVGEQIGSSAVTTTLTACTTGTADGLGVNALVSITNLNAIAFSEVWYVADVTTTITNFDGTVIAGAGPAVPAFRIDYVGANQPLLPGSDAGADGIFSPGETWTFIVQDFVNSLGVSPALFGTEGLPSAGLGSSGSIIAVPVPEPTSAALLGLGLLGLSLAKRRAR